MEFSNLHKDTDCNCLSETFQDNDKIYCIKTNKNKLREVDMKSKWEKGERLEDTDCKRICGKKGKSVTLINEHNEEKILEIFRQLFPISPTYKPFITKVKFGEETGVLKNTPSLRNEFHHDFYKCDTFKFENVMEIESIPLAQNV